MGCSSSKPELLTSDERRDRQMILVEAQFPRTFVSPHEAHQLYTVFSKLDASDDGLLQEDEFALLLKKVDRLYHTKRSKKLFTLVARKRPDLNYMTFVEGCIRMCALTHYSLLCLAFALLDRDGSGSLELNEIQTLVSELTEDPGVKLGGYLNGVMISRDAVELAAGEAVLTKVSFMRFALNFPAILYPAARLQAALREGLCGVEWWQHYTTRQGRLTEKCVKRVSTFTNELVESTEGPGHALAVALNKLSSGFVSETDLAPQATLDSLRSEYVDIWGEFEFHESAFNPKKVLSRIMSKRDSWTASKRVLPQDSSAVLGTRTVFSRG